ncbi:hypothetical protein BBK14_22890 [Parafrankia soli]|uniref:Uncharacterized protein n=1 Tax=Parafrankia soli TaxID=2599596 RepID=A0A1S1PUH0_9ACTN|nr:hypothetical protein [Parafrankia soli]OHV24891.1 hypothetical protein BBK14_22890 [Parafrankia soli]
MDELEDAWFALRTGIKIGVSLPHLAADALAAGFDSPALRELAALGVRDDLEARRLLPVALTELGHSLEPQTDAWGELFPWEESRARSGLGSRIWRTGELFPWEESRARFEPDLVARTEQALTIVQRDLDETEAGLGRLTLHWSGEYGEDGEPQLLIGFGGEPHRGGGNPAECLDGADLPHRVLSLAENVQECVMEMFQFYWPTCARHRRGLHLPDWDWDGVGWPVWRCRAEGGHAVAPIGGLRKEPPVS